MNWWLFTREWARRYFGALAVVTALAVVVAIGGVLLVAIGGLPMWLWTWWATGSPFTSWTVPPHLRVWVIGTTTIWIALLISAAKTGVYTYNDLASND